MKITTQQIKKIINEEIEYLLKETYGETATDPQKVVELFLKGDRESAASALLLIQAVEEGEKKKGIEPIFRKEVIYQLQVLIKQYEGYRRDFDDTTTMDVKDAIWHILTYAERALKAIESDSLDYEDAFYTDDDGLDVY